MKKRLKPAYYLYLAVLLATTIFSSSVSAASPAAPALQSPPSNLSRLKVSANKRFLTKSDGTPFFWMGDTAWFLPVLSSSDRDLYLADTAQKGFNAIWVDLTAYGFVQIGENPFLNDNTDTPNENYWSRVDALITAADSYGIYTGLVVAWPYHVVYEDNTLAKIDTFGRWLGQRYGGRDNVLWVISGEYSSTSGYCASCIASAEKDKFEHMARSIREGGGAQLMTIHPGVHSSVPDFGNSSWLDFTIFQSGHQRDNEAYGLPEIHKLIAGDYNASPIRPTMDGEPNYEGLPNGWYADNDANASPINAADVRRKAYWSVFAGAFGHVYGSESMEVFHLQSDNAGHYADSPLRYLLVDWRTALSSTGRTQMRHLRSLVESRPILGRVPDQTLLSSNAGTGIDHVQATRGSDGSYAWVYIPNGGVVTVNMTKLAGPAVNASWYNPRDGSYVPIGQFPNSGTLPFDGPGNTASDNDWILVLDSTGSGPSFASFSYFTVETEGAQSWISAGASAGARIGYARVQNQQDISEGIAVFSLRQDGVLVSEVSVPSVRSLTQGRIYAEVSDSVNTGVSIVNPNDSPVTVSFFFTDSSGNDFGSGAVEIGAKSQLVHFLSEAPFSSGSVLGTFTFESPLPVAVLALRGRTNERNEFLSSTLPVSPLAPTSSAVVFPHFVDGGGWATNLVVINPTDEAVSGLVEFYGEVTPANAVRTVSVTIDGQTGSSFPFSIPPRSAQRLQTTGDGSTVQVGAVKVVPRTRFAPVGVAIVEYRSPAGITTSAVGIPAIAPDGMFRLYTQSDGLALQTGVAITNTLSSDISVALDLSTVDGTTVASTSLVAPANGHLAKILQEIPGFEFVPKQFQGVLKVTASASGMTVVGIRLRQNERQDVLTTVIPAVLSESASGLDRERFFAFFVDGAGYATHFVLFNAGGEPTSGTLRFFSPSGEPLALQPLVDP